MYRRHSSGWIKHLDFEILDLICIEVAFYAAFFIRHWKEYSGVPTLYNRLALILALIDIVVIFFSDNYKHIIQRTKWIEMFAVVRHVTIVELLLLVYTYFTREADVFSRTVFFVSWGLAILLCTGERWVWKKIVRTHFMKEKNQSNMLVITNQERSTDLTLSLRAKPYRAFRICGVALLHEGITNERLDANIPLLFGREPMLEFIRQGVVDEAYIDYFEDPEEISELTDLFLSMGITVHIGTSFLPDSLPNRMVEEIGNETSFTTSLKVAREWEILIKRMGDILGALVGMLLTGILLIFVGPAIKIADPGPIFFKQERVGKNGRVFYLYKFRTMVVDAEAQLADLMKQNEMEGHMFKMEHDPRIIGAKNKKGKGIGHFLRSTSLDEFPQFFNVLKGDMSLVGTRPPTLKEFEQYDLHHKIRLSMKPGITGIWQTSGRNEINNFERVVEMDAEYIEKWTIALDIKLIFKTIGVLFTKKSY